MALKKESMSFPVFAWSARLFSLLMLVGCIGVILLLDPEGRTWSTPLFFGIWFITWMSVALTLLVSLYRRVLGEERTLGFRWRIIEQAILISGLVTALLILHYYRAFVWWTAGLVLAFVLLIEFSLRVHHRRL